MDLSLVFYTIVLIAAVFGAAIVSTTKMKYREKILLIVGIIIIVGAAAPTWNYVEQATAAPANVVRVTTSRYLFKVEGKVKVGEPTLIETTSTDYQHSVFNRELGINLQSLPGYVNTQIIVAKRAGTFTLRCAEYCGEGHSAMVGELEVVGDAGNAQGGAIPDGQKLYTVKGCAACHTIGKGTLIGPDLANIGAKRDANYLVKWLQDPEQVYKEAGKKPINAGVSTTMPNLALSADEAKALADYLLKQK